VAQSGKATVAFTVPGNREARAGEDEDTARLVTRFQAGDQQAFAALYDRYFDRVYGYLRVLLKDFHEAEDLTQQVFLKLFDSLHTYERRDKPFRAWLFVVVRNAALDHLQRSGRLEPVDPAEIEGRRSDRVGDEDAASVLNWITDSDLSIFIERLSLPQRQVLLLRFLLDLSDRQIAAIMDRTPSDVRMLQSRAIRFLRARLAAIGRAPLKDSPRETPPASMRMPPRHATVTRSRRWSLRA
jgi:RNA polymerase sigma-70 factor (ECF subfamily)